MEETLNTTTYNGGPTTIIIAQASPPPLSVPFNSIFSTKYQLHKRQYFSFGENPKRQYLPELELTRAIPKSVISCSKSFKLVSSSDPILIVGDELLEVCVCHTKT
jgi:hypothetical protein